MSFSTLDGLMLGTRCGTIDPGVILYLPDHRLSAADVQRLLYQQSVLLGSRESPAICANCSSPDPRAAEAVDLFVYRIGRELGRMAAALHGLDAIVFTGVHRRERRGDTRASAATPRGWVWSWMLMPT